MKMKSFKFKGYIPILRRIVLLLRDGDLGFVDFGFYIFLIMLTDWDGHHETYGQVAKTDIQIGEIAGCDSSTVGRRKRCLVELGLVDIDDRGLMEVKDFQKYRMGLVKELAKLDVVDLQEDIAQTQAILAKTPSSSADLQNSQDRNDIQSFSVSSKDDLDLSGGESECLSDEELDRISVEITTQNADVTSHNKSEF